MAQLILISILVIFVFSFIKVFYGRNNTEEIYIDDNPELNKAPESASENITIEEPAQVKKKRTYKKKTNKKKSI